MTFQLWTEKTIQNLKCNNCGKVVSTGFTPIPTETPDKGIIIRAWIECPECMEKRGHIQEQLLKELNNIIEDLKERLV